MTQSPEPEKELPNVEIPIPINIPLGEDATLNLKVDAGINNGEPAVDGGSIGITVKF